MEPERESPYWKAIVGDNWPEISPGDWNALETSVRDGADALDVDSLDRARRGFDDTVRASIGLQPVKDDMQAQALYPRAFADALTAAADTFQDFSDLVYRTRNQILDIVDRATRRIQAASKADTSDDDGADGESEEEKEEKKEEIRQRISGIVADAKEEVEDVVRNALSAINPTGLPSLAKIADELGQPGPWDATAPGDEHAPVGNHHPDADHPGVHHPDGQYPGGWQPGAPPESPLPGFPSPLDPDLDLGRPAPYPGLPAPGGAEPVQASDGRPAPGPNVVAPTTVAQGPASAAPADGGATVNYVPAATSGAGPETLMAGSSPRMSSGPTPTDSSNGGATTDPGTQAVTDSSDTAGQSSESIAAEEVPDGQTPFATPLFAGGAAPASAGAPGSIAGAGPTGSAVSAPSSQIRQPVSMADSRGSVPDSRSSVADPKPAAVGPAKVAAASGHSAAASAAPTKQQLPHQNTQPETGRPKAGGADTGGSDELIRDVVGAAMLSAAAPTFVLGDRVDGDLVLARTILSGVLAAVGSSAVGLSWAVSVLRNAGGVSAFVTSNEGRGWIPAGLFLPREISTPWLWSESDGAAWEGVSDPARVLAEFGLAWGRKSGAQLSALASSQPLEPEMRRQLGQVPMVGEVAASAAMDLGSPRSGLVDRLGLVAAPQLVARVSGLPAASIGARCTELASDAHVRVGKSQPGTAASLGAPQLRERILVALQRGAAVAEQWWDELRDVDDLLAASMLALRADVSRVALGELRSEQSDGRSDAATLRSMVFERRCNELVSLLAEEPTRQCLRDAVYAHGQLVDHPLFVQTPAATSDRDGARGRPTISAGPTTH